MYSPEINPDDTPLWTWFPESVWPSTLWGFFLGKIFVNRDDKLTKREKHLHSHMIACLHEEGRRAHKTSSHSRKRGAMPRQQGRGWDVCVSKGSGEGCSDLARERLESSSLLFLTFFPLDVTVPGPTMSIFEVACITGALWAKRGERGILREAQDEGRRKSSVCLAWLLKRLLCRLSLSFYMLHADECHKYGSP